MSELRNFEDVLDESLERLVRGETLEEVLRRFPEQSNDLKPLLDTVVTARRVMPVQPRPEFRERARYQLHAALQEKALKKSRPAFAWGWHLRPVGLALAVLLAISLTGGGTVAAARSSMPDSPLYPVKLATEQAQMALTFSELGKAELNARFADERVEEIAYLAVSDPGKIPEVTENMKRHLGEITSRLARAPVTIGPVPQPVLTAPAPAAANQPAEIVPFSAPAAGIAPAEVSEPVPQPAVAQAPQAEKEAGPEQREPEAAKTLSANDTGKETGKESEKEDRKDDRKAKLKSTVEGQASSNTARLRALLETAPESSRDALRKAIEDSESEYKKAIEALDD